MGSSKGVTRYENKQDQSPCKCSISGLPRTGAYFLHWLFPGCFHLQLQALDLSWQCQAWREQQWMYFSVCKDVLPGRDPEIPSLGAEWAIRHLFIQGWLCHLPLQAHVCPGNWTVAAFLHHRPLSGTSKMSFSWNHWITTCQKLWLCLCISCMVGDTLGSSGVKFGLSSIRYEKKYCPFTMAEYGSFSVLRSGLSCLESPYLPKAISSTILCYGTSLWFRKLFIEIRLNFITEFGRCLSSSLISIKNVLDPSCIHSLQLYSASHCSMCLFRVHPNPSIVA